MASAGGKRVLKVAKEAQPYRTELTPVAFLRRSAYVFGERTAIVHGARRYTYRQFEERANRLASGLRAMGLRHLDRVAAILPNIPAMLDMHYGVPAAGLVLVPINTRLSRDEIGYILNHSGPEVLFVDAEFEPLVKPLDLPGVTVIRVDDTGAAGDPYEDFLAARLARAVRAVDRGRVRDDLDQLHLGHHRPAQGRDVPRTAAPT